MEFYHLVEIHDSDFEDELITVPTSYLSKKMGVDFVKYLPKPHSKEDMLRIAHLVKEKHPAPDDWEDYACIIKQQALTYKEAGLLVQSYLRIKILSLQKDYVPQDVHVDSSIQNDAVTQNSMEVMMLQSKTNMENLHVDTNQVDEAEDNESAKLFNSGDEGDSTMDDVKQMKHESKSVGLGKNMKFKNTGDTLNHQLSNKSGQTKSSNVPVKPNFSKSVLTKKQNLPKKNSDEQNLEDVLSASSNLETAQVVDAAASVEVPPDEGMKKNHFGYSGHKVPLQRSDDLPQALPARLELSIDAKTLKQILSTATTWVTNTVIKYLNVKLYESQNTLDEIKTSLVERENIAVDINRDMLMKSDIERLYGLSLPFQKLEDFLLFDTNLRSNTDDLGANLVKYIDCVALPSNQLRENVRTIIKDFMSCNVTSKYTASKKTGMKLVFAETALASQIIENLIKIYKKATGLDHKNYKKTDILREVGDVFNSSRDWGKGEDDENNSKNERKEKKRKRKSED